MDNPIPEIDRQRLEDMVAQYRHQIENLYRLAHLQGQIAADKDTLEKLQRKEVA